MKPKLNFYRILKFFVVAIANSVVAYIVAFQLRFEFDFIDQVPQSSVGLGLLLLLVARMLSYPLFGAAEVAWRYFSLAEFGPVLRAHIASSAMFVTSVTIAQLSGFPRSIFFIEFMVSLILNAGVAILVRILFEHQLYPRHKHGVDRPKDCLILGAGNSGHLLIKMLWSQRYNPLAVLDDAERNQGLLVHGVPVIGKLSELAEVLGRFSSVDYVFLAIPSLSVARTNQIQMACEARKIDFRRLQSFEDIAVRRTSESQPDVPIELLLNRQIKFDREAEVKSAYNNRTILVTGGAGSIGSEVIRQLAQLNPKHIVVLDSSEYFQFLFEKELKERYSHLSFNCVLADVTDRNRLRFIMDESAPDIIIHTAAYKHVPLTELNAYAAFATNVIGTSNVVEESLRIKAERLIILSSDKAVNPVNVMGCTKRLAEILTQALLRSTANSDTKAAIVRFGNVINSRGSVIPLFREQIIAGGPITVTDPNVERFFMSTQEAVHLMLAASTLGENAEIFTLDMGEKIKIAEVAREMLELYGRSDIPITFTGLRPGERMSEEVASEGEILAETAFPKVRRISELHKNPSAVLSGIKNLASRSSTLQEGQLSAEIFGLIGVKRS